MTTQQITSTRQLKWDFNTHCYGACANAAKDIVKGNTVKFDVFTRPNKEDSTELQYKCAFYFGLVDIDGNPALRVSHCSNLDANLSHSLIASWNDNANDTVFISARLTLFLAREGADWFVNPVIV